MNQDGKTLQTLPLTGQTSGRMKMPPKDWIWKGGKVDPPERVTKEQVQEMIDDAIRQLNRNASIISFWVGWVVLALFAEGLLRLIGVIEPLFPWLKITL